MQWFRISAAAGDGPARAELGNLLLTGIGEEDDRFLIYKGYEQAAASGDPVAAYNCAVLPVSWCWRGRATSGRQRCGCASRRPSAERAILVWAASCRGTRRGPDLAEGRRWIARAAEAGMVDAQVRARRDDADRHRRRLRSARCPWHCSKRRRRTAMWPPCLATGVVYGGVHGVPANHGAAQHWFRAAAEHGHPAAQE